MNFTKLSSLTKSYWRHVCGAALLFANSGEVFRHGRTFVDYIVRKFVFSTSTRVIGKNVVVGVTHRRRCVVRLAMRVLKLAKRRWKSEIQHRSGRRGRRQRRFRPTMLVNLCRKRAPTTTTTTTTTTKSDDAERLGRPSWSRAGDGPVFI